MTRRRWSGALSFAVAVLLAARLAAGEPVLRITAAPGGASVTVDAEALAALPRTTIRTSTIWTEGEREFTGVALSDLVAAFGLSGSAIRARALNDYAVEIPMSDAAPGAALVAYLLDGRPMTVRDKGPIWIVYPYDADPRFRTETIYSRSIWQLTEIEAIE